MLRKNIWVLAVALTMPVMLGLDVLAFIRECARPSFRGPSGMGPFDDAPADCWMTGHDENADWPPDPNAL